VTPVEAGLVNDGARGPGALPVTRTRGRGGAPAAAQDRPGWSD